MNLDEVFVVLTLLGSGNIVLMGLAYYAWKRHKEQMAEMRARRTSATGSERPGARGRGGKGPDYEVI